jgi:hypothetical protein
VILVVGDEAVPTVIGYTPVGAEETSCAWVLKKEHLGLDEVPTLLNRINLDKRRADKERGLREHEFFVPNGSKILVVSYMHLRRAGLDGYVSDFDDMVKNMMSVTGDCGIEILPVVLVVYEGLDQVGRELISGLQEWIKWVGEKSGRNRIVELAGTGGREHDNVVTMTQIWKPSFLMMHEKQQGVKKLGTRGNTLTMLRGERVEWKLDGALPAREIKIMMAQGKGDDETEQDRRASFDQGVSVIGEFAFTQEIGRFCRESVREDSFKGNYQFNLKEQMARSATWSGWREEKTLRVVMVGGSQMGRIKDELKKLGGDRVDIVWMVRIPESWMRRR